MATNESVEFDFDALFNGTDDEKPETKTQASAQTVDLSDEIEPSKPTVVDVVKARDAQQPGMERLPKSEEPNLVPYLALIQARIDKIEPRLRSIEQGIEDILLLLRDEGDFPEAKPVEDVPDPKGRKK